MKLCTDCDALVSRPGRCPSCRKAHNALRNDPRVRNMARPVMACPRCGKVERMTVDHRVPLSAGGGNDPDNLDWLCLACNVAKRNGVGRVQ